MASKQILGASKIDRILLRMAYEIWEKNYDAKRIILAGITKKGPILAKMIEKKLKQVNCDKEIAQLEISINKDKPTVESVVMSSEFTPNENDVVIVVDDVLYTGSTMIHAVVPFIEQGFKKVQVAVLVFRDYLRFPIRADFVGISLASTTQEHVEVSLEENNSAAYLN
ncbi:MAG: phosphoribosyltransferase family protein [Bacteroidia bacterium]